MSLKKTQPSSQRPRERLCQFGAQILSDAELLAILFGTGDRQKNVVELAQSILNQAGNLTTVFNYSLHELTQFNGIGIVKYCQLQASFELAKRYYREPINHPKPLKNSLDVRNWLQAELKNYEHEVFAVLYLNCQYQLLRFEILFEGTLNHTAVYPREIAKRCLKYNASAIIVAHNHPSGNPKASKQDIELTQHLKKVLTLIDVELLEHLIIAGAKFTSLPNTD